MLGLTDHDYHPPVLARQYIEEDLEVMRTGRPILHQVWLVPDAGGTPLWYDCSKLPVRDAAGSVIGIAGLMRPYERAGAAPQEYRRLLPAVEYARQHLGEAIGVGDLAVQAGLSVSQFQREFRRVFGMTPGAYLLEVRLQAARRLLEQTPQALSAIALDCGFHDQSHFTKRFKAATGLVPRAYTLGAPPGGWESPARSVAGDGRGRLLDRRLRAAAPHIRAVDELISNASPSLQLRLSWCGPVSRGHTIRVWQ
jgi:AraC-like DNA-binding protein